MYAGITLVRSSVPRRVNFEFGTDCMECVILGNAKSIRVQVEETYLLIRKLYKLTTLINRPMPASVHCTDLEILTLPPSVHRRSWMHLKITVN
jgi:hypothetical protein